jgi:signal peptidase I
MLDCTVKVTEPQGELILELAKGLDRFQARFNLSNGECTLVRLTGRLGDRQDRKEIAKKSTSVTKAGSYHVRFANFDERLTVWVDRQLPFGDGVTYTPASEEGPIGENDLSPARIGASKAGIAVSHLQLWRDLYYTIPPPPYSVNAEMMTMYVQKGHYLALGDNSSSSSDSRYWGLVPERLLLGRALAVYFPFWPFDQRAGFIR